MSDVQRLGKLLAEINGNSESVLWDDVDQVIRDVLPEDHFIDSRYFIGQPLKVLPMGNTWMHGDALYIKSEYRKPHAEGVWHMLQFVEGSAVWMPDAHVVMPNMCGECNRDCPADDYLCNRCRNKLA